MNNDTWLWIMCIKNKTKDASKVFYCKSCLTLAMSTCGSIDYQKKHKVFKFKTKYVFKSVNKNVVLVSNFWPICCEQCNNYLGEVKGHEVTMCYANTKFVMFNNDSTIKFTVN